MKKSLYLKTACVAGMALAAGIGASQAATSFVISSFDNAASITSWGSFQNWNGSTGTASWAAGPTYDVAGSSSSGSIKLVIDYDGGSKNGGAVVLNIAKDASAFNALEWDAMVDPGSGLDTNGNVCDIKVGVQTTSSYHYHATDQNLAPGGWHHFKVDASNLGAPEWNQIVQVLIQCYDNHYGSAQTATLYVDNIKFTGPDATYPNFTTPQFRFDTNVWVGTNGSPVNGGQGNLAHRYGDATQWTWSANDSHGDPASGSLYIASQLDPAQNCVILDVPFSPNWAVYGPPTTNDLANGITNWINGRQYTNIEFDVLWDATNSTIGLAEFNSVGDVNGFPMAILANNGTNNNWGEYEACGNVAPNIPDAASNAWVHMSVPLNNLAANIDQVNGIYIKKYNNSSTIAGAAYFYIDNITFDGALKTVPAPTMTISKAAPGLNIVTVAGPYGPYERENLQATDTSFSFVDSASPWTYSMTIGYMPPASQPITATIGFVPLSSGATVTEPEWDYADATCFRIDVQRAGANSTAVLRYKYNAAGGNGTLYGGNPTFTTGSPIEGTWAFTITANTNILCVAPDGSSTNLPFPVVTSAADVSAQMAGGVYLMFGGTQGGSAGAGARFTLSDVSVKNGSTTVLTDNFLADASINAGKWNLLTDSGAGTTDLYLLGADTKYFLEWTTIGGPGWTVMTNTSLGTAFGANASISGGAQLLGSFYHTEVATSNMPASGPLFFKLSHAP